MDRTIALKKLSSLKIKLTKRLDKEFSGDSFIVKNSLILMLRQAFD